VKRYQKRWVQTDKMEGMQGENEEDNKHRINDYFQEASTITGKPSNIQLLLRMAACALALGTLIMIDSRSTSDAQVGNAGPNSTITPVWTTPVPPAATINQSYTACVPDHADCTYLWSVASGSATLIDATTPVVTFTPKATGILQLQCVVTDSGNNTSTGIYSIKVEFRQIKCYRSNRQKKGR